MAKCLASSDQTFGISMATLLANALDLLLAIIWYITPMEFVLWYILGVYGWDWPPRGCRITLECDLVRASDQQAQKRRGSRGQPYEYATRGPCGEVEVGRMGGRWAKCVRCAGPDPWELGL